MNYLESSRVKVCFLAPRFLEFCRFVSLTMFSRFRIFLSIVEFSISLDLSHAPCSRVVWSVLRVHWARRFRAPNESKCTEQSFFERAVAPGALDTVVPSALGAMFLSAQWRRVRVHWAKRFRAPSCVREDWAQRSRAPSGSLSTTVNWAQRSRVPDHQECTGRNVFERSRALGPMLSSARCLQVYWAQRPRVPTVALRALGATFLSARGSECTVEGQWLGMHWAKCFRVPSVSECTGRSSESTGRS